MRTAARDRPRHERLLGQVDAIAGELRRRIGEVFTIRELAEAYADAERWSRDAVEEAGVETRPEELVVAQDAAFHLYARGAVDYAP